MSDLVASGQAVDQPLTRHAIFLVLSVRDDDESLATAREVVSGIADFVKTVGFRSSEARLSCVVGIGRALWDRLRPDGPRPIDLRPFNAIRGENGHDAPSTPGDVLFHIRSERADLCFELERQLLNALGGAVVVEDEVSGFRYFDARDLLGFVDGTANPTGAEISDAAWITGDADPDFGGGAYVVVQKYVHDLEAWGALTVEQQEAVIGRTKVENIELDDDPDAPAHKTLTTIEDPQTGEELDIIRDNMPFGRPGAGEYGTYFIGYASRLWVIETMLQRMFLGDRPGRYDRILDFSTAVTGTTFFVPTPDVLEGLADETPAPAEEEAAEAPPAAPAPPPATGGLGIGSLRD
ncbi:Dyp-type peroxidase [Conexibacter woesei]|uniref:Dyp-type peroxidase n=1 Tax=Conexibacter woesei TaxID=191495 RepID=UPI00041D788F|nr:Dyp-type peroxidase [Conexibacter woesei]